MRTVYLYPHMHWDREWFEPFESSRLQLVEVVGKVLDDLESGDLPQFYLDGQAIIFDDLLELKPELKPRLQAAMRNGTLSAGPWYVLCDQMLVGGESLVRNLAYGIEKTKQYGPPAMIGYCPDTFGHTQDLPRILNGFGIKTAVVWRGAPALEMGPAFWWQSPDGSKVLAYHLTRGYAIATLHEAAGTGNGITVEAFDKLAEQVADWADGKSSRAVHPLYEPIDAALMPVGVEYSTPPPHFSKLVKDLDKHLHKSKQLRVVATTLGEYLELVAKHAGKSMKVVQGVDGELRSNRWAPLYDRSYLLYGVLSTRLYLKRANRLAEHKLVELVEPVFSMLSAYELGLYPQSELDHAWKLLLQNHPHDSICGTSVDQVHREMLTRYARLEDFCDSLLVKAAELSAGSSVGGVVSPGDPQFCCDRWAVFNTSSSAVTAPAAVRLALPVGAVPPALLQIESSKRAEQLFSGWGTVPYYKEVDIIDGWIWPGTVPAFGTKSIAWPPESARVDEDVTPVSVASRRLSNGLLDVTVSAGGRLTVSQAVPDGQPELYRLVHGFRDVGDGGDTYNFDPLPDDKVLSAGVVDVSVGQCGPHVGSLFITHEIDLPEEALPDSSLLKRLGVDLGKITVLKRSPKRIKHRITTELMLKRGVPILFFESSFNNEAQDHRLEVVFDTQAPVRTTFSENHYSLVQRHHSQSAQREKLPVPLAHEAIPDRYPCQRFFIANGQLFLNSGMPEYGVAGNNVSMTALRAVSMLSRWRLFTRGGGAGPNIATPEANCLGANRLSYAWAPLPESKNAPGILSDKALARAYELAELFAGPLWATLAKGDRLPTASLISIDNKAVRIVSCSQSGSQLVVRLLNVSREDQVAEVTLKKATFASASQCALSGAPVRAVPMDGNKLRLAVTENQLLTLKLQLRTGAPQKKANEPKRKPGGRLSRKRV